MALAGSRWFRILRNTLVVLVALVALYAAIGFLLVPYLAKPRIEALVSDASGRRATLADIAFNPFTFRAQLTGLSVADRDPARTLFAFDALDVDLSTMSVWRWAPVLDAVKLVRPRVGLVRDADGAYNVQDIVDRAAQRPEGPTPLFSINNIEIDEGSVSLDDQPHRRKVEITNLDVGIPFLSSLPYEADIRVTPRLAGAIDGARFGLGGTSTTPFADTQEATLELNLDGMALPQYAQYAPLPGGLLLKDGALTTRLTLTFVTEKRTPKSISLKGTARLDRLALARSDATPLVSAASVDVAVGGLDPLGRSIAIDRLAIDGLDVDIRRAADGTIELVRLLGAGPSATRPAQGQPAEQGGTGRPWTFTVADARIAHGNVKLADSSVSPPFQSTLGNVAVDAKNIGSTGTGRVDVAFDSDEGAHFESQVDVDVANASARGRFALKTFHLVKLYPYYAGALDVDVRRGTVDLAGEVAVSASSTPVQVTLAQGAGTLADIEMGLRGSREPLWRIPKADINGIEFDLARRNVAIGSVEARQAALRIVRQSDGVIEFRRLMKNASAEATPAAAHAAGADPEWQLRIGKLLFERIGADFEDRVPQPPVKLRIADARIVAEKFSNVKDEKGTIDFAARIGSGRLQVAGALTTRPFGGDWRVNVRTIDLVPLRPYFEARTNVIVTGGAISANGRLGYSDTGAGPARATYKGDVTVSDFGSLDRPTSQELARWKSASLTGIDLTSEPFRLGMGAISLDQFFARLIINSDGTLNLQRLLAPETQDAPPAAPVATVAGASTKTVSSEERKALPVSIGRIEVSAGEVQFSDFFVQPNYSAHLTDVAGFVSALSAERAGDVELAARVEHSAPVEIRGSVNPFARELSLDLNAKANGVDLPPLTPYSVKYAGYGIQKGKLSLDVHYKIENRTLSATNKLNLDQLTFGERVDSPTATKLPVLLAVALLKDRNGVINLDLPIEGTLDDPQFSVWRIIVQIVVNLITKAVTAPFALLGAIAGGSGGGEQLAYVEFGPGRADLSDAAQTKLRSLAKALAERPGLKLDATGRAIPDVDRDGLKRATLDRAIRVQKQKALVEEGKSAPSPDAITIEAAEYPKYLTAVYRDTKLADKPRNVLGLEKEIEPAQMEALLLASYRADDEALRDLANRRALAVKDWFVGPGAIPADRIFVVASKLDATGVQDKGPPTRVDFAIR